MKTSTMATTAVTALAFALAGTSASATVNTATFTKAEYNSVEVGYSYTKVKNIADGPGKYLGRCVEGGRLCTTTSKWYIWKSTNGKHVWVGFDGGKMKRKFRA